MIRKSNENNFIHLETVLKKHKKFLDRKGEIIKSSVRDAALKFDETLIKSLLSDVSTRQQFFKRIDDSTVFDYRIFIDYIEDKNFLLDSYTKFSNKIGLTISNKHIKQLDDVVLTFPFKDCILEGGQTKEEKNRKEIFFNETLAQDEINKLLDKKIITNAKHYFCDDMELKENSNVSFTRDENGHIKDNLIIKGNNLLALHTLKSNFTGQIKLIYIDPPFNTGKDDFNYNDSFNHSSWLTFMKNRLEVARELLSDDGFICVHVGNEQASYIQVLLDEIFKRENYLNHITMTTNAASGFKATSAKIFSTANHIYCYSKSVNVGIPNKIYVPKEYDTNYKFYLVNPTEVYSKWKYKNLLDVIWENEGYKDLKSFKKDFSQEEIFQKMKEFAHLNKDRVFRTAAIGGGALKKRQETIDKSKKEKNVVLQHPNEDVDGFYILNGAQILFWKNVYHEIDGQIIPATTLTDVWTDIGFTGIASEGGVTLKNGKKPEHLLKRIIDLFTNEGDIVLDYHLGSGTTAAVAHKMYRQYIGIEQLSYGKNDSLERLKNILRGDKSGISKIVKWKGGGEFISFDLDKYNQKFIDDLSMASEKNILNLYSAIKEKSFLNYDVDIQQIEKNIEEFKSLSLEDKKELLVSILNKNQLYKNFSEMYDEEFKITNEIKRLNNDFYNILDKE